MPISQQKRPTVVFCLSFNAKGLEVTQKKGVVTIEKEGSVPKFVNKVKSVSFSAKRAISMTESTVCDREVRIPADTKRVKAD